MKEKFKQISLRAKALIVLFVLLFAGVFALSMVYRSNVNAKYAMITENEEKIKTLRSGITTERKATVDEAEIVLEVVILRKLVRSYILLLSLQVVSIFLVDG